MVYNRAEDERKTWSKLDDLSNFHLSAYGMKHVKLATRWIPSALAFTGAALVFTLYFTDWSAVCKYIPFYGGKYKEAEEEYEFKKTRFIV